MVMVRRRRVVELFYFDRLWEPIVEAAGPTGKAAA
jgi:hypothetical protein